MTRCWLPAAGTQAGISSIQGGQVHRKGVQVPRTLDALTEHCQVLSQQLHAQVLHPCMTSSIMIRHTDRLPISLHLPAVGSLQSVSHTPAGYLCNRCFQPFERDHPLSMHGASASSMHRLACAAFIGGE